MNDKQLQKLKQKEEEKFIEETSEAMHRFHMATSGSVTLDERVRQYRKEHSHAQDS